MKKTSPVGLLVGLIAILLAVAMGVLAQRAEKNAVGPTPANQSVRGLQIFPPDDPWNKDISGEPVDPNSQKLVASIGADRPLHPDFGSFFEGSAIGIPFTVIGKDVPRLKVEFQYKEESDQELYPIPPNAPIEGGPNSTGDRHVLLVDRDDLKLYEIFSAFPQEGGKWWKAGSGAIWDLKKLSYGQRPKGWTSADAAGLSLFAGLVRYEEVVEQKELKHAVRFAVTRSRRAYVYPATHFASNSNDPTLPPMGMRVRMRGDYDISSFSPNVQVILKGLKRYGMILADNGSNWYIGGAPDPRWDNDELHAITRIKGSAFEVIKMGEVATQ